MGKRTRRTKREINEDIFRSASKLIEEKGFNKLTVVGLSQKAKIEPAVFYNRYDSLTDFIDEFVKSFDYWFSETLSPEKERRDLKEQYSHITTVRFNFSIMAGISNFFNTHHSIPVPRKSSGKQ